MATDAILRPTFPRPCFLSRGETLYLRTHRMRSGERTVTVTVPRKPSDAGIDPCVVRIDLERSCAVEEVEIER